MQKWIKFNINKTYKIENYVYDTYLYNLYRLAVQILVGKNIQNYPEYLYNNDCMVHAIDDIRQYLKKRETLLKIINLYLKKNNGIKHKKYEYLILSFWWQMIRQNNNNNNKLKMLYSGGWGGRLDEVFFLSLEQQADITSQNSRYLYYGPRNKNIFE